MRAHDSWAQGRNGTTADGNGTGPRGHLIYHVWPSRKIQELVTKELSGNANAEFLVRSDGFHDGIVYLSIV